MNAVKRCLALIAATVVIGACGGDPTADLAGTDLKIRATPGTVWMYHSKPTTVLIEAVDATGAPQPGSWTATATGPLSVTFDSTFQPTNTGTLRISSRFVISASSEGNGTVIFAGTGGKDTINVRVAPDTANFQVTASTTTPTLYQPVTVTAPAGLVFTGGTTVRFYKGGLALDTANGGLSFPTITGWSADSTQLTFVMGPSADTAHFACCFARFTGVASRETPTLQTVGRTSFLFDTMPIVDTVNFPLGIAFSTSGTTVDSFFLDTLVITAPAGYRISPTATLEVFRTGATSATPTNPDGYLVTNGQSALKILGVSADSSTMRALIAPGARGRFKLKPIIVQTASKGLRDNGIRFMVRSSASIDLRSSVDTAGATVHGLNIAFDDSVGVAEGDTVTATAPAGLVFIPGKGVVSIHATNAGTFSGGDSARITGFSADSTQVKFILPPGATGKFRYSLMARRADPTITFASRSRGTISAAAAPAVVATMTPGTANMNDTVTVALSNVGPYRFRPTSQASLGGFNGLVTSISADSLTMKLFAPPGFTGPLTLTNIKYANLPTFQVVAATATSLTSNAPTSLGLDNPKTQTIALVNGPSAAGKVVGFWDQATLTAPDFTGDAGTATGVQYIRVHALYTGNVQFIFDWSQGTASNTDMDYLVVADDGAYDTELTRVTGGAASASKPETVTYKLTAGTNYVIALIDFGASGLDPAGFTGLANTTGLSVTMVGK